MLDQHATSVSEIVESTQEITESNLIEQVKEDERRVFPRRAARWSATVTTKNKEVVSCRTRDVSERGASISIPYDFRKNAMVVLEINVVYKSLRKRIKILGQVKHSSIAADGYTVGVLIKDAPEAAQSFLAAYSNKKI